MSERTPELDEPVHLTSYDARWERAFEQERQLLRALVEGDESRIEHIGSTAVPGACGKPIVDLMIGVEALPPAPQLGASLAAEGYEALGEAGVPGRLYFRKRRGHACNVHVVEHRGAHWRANLAVRDYLRAHPEIMRRYEEVKRTAARANGMLLPYSEAKREFVERLRDEALRWADARRGAR